MTSPVVRLLSKFPLKTYPSEDITDIPLQDALAGRSFYYGCQDKTNVPDFTLLIGSYQVDEKSNELYAMDPDCLFVQCCLARKHGLTLPGVDNSARTSGNNAKILSVATKDVPLLLVESGGEGNYMTREELLQDIGEKYLSIKERQWAKLLDSNVKQVWARETAESGQLHVSTSEQQSYCRDKSHAILQLFESEYSTLPANTYFQLKLAALVFCIVHGPATATQAYISSHCPTLAANCRPTPAWAC